jgi:hypothetical protein
VLQNYSTNSLWSNFKNLEFLKYSLDGLLQNPTYFLSRASRVVPVWLVKLGVAKKKVDQNSPLHMLAANLNNATCHIQVASVHLSYYNVQYDI